MEITREAYEQGRVRRRDGGDFRIYAWPDETRSSYIIGERETSGCGWHTTSWSSNGKHYEHRDGIYDLILTPRTVWVNLYRRAYDSHVVNGVMFDYIESARQAACTDALAVAVPIEIEDESCPT